MSNLGMLWDETTQQEIPDAIADENPVQFSNAATGTRGWQSGNSVFMQGTPSAPAAAAKPDRMAALDGEAQFWDEPVQESLHPNFDQNLKAARDEVSQAFSKVGTSGTLKDAKDIILRIGSKYAYDTPEVIPALKAMFKDRLPGSSASELSDIRTTRGSLKKYENEYSVINQMEDEWQKKHPGMYKDFASGRITPIAETPETKRREAIQAKLDENRILSDAEKTGIQEAQTRNPYVAGYNKGSAGKMELVPVDTKDEMAVMEAGKKGWTLAVPPQIDYQAELAKESASKSFGNKVARFLPGGENPPVYTAGQSQPPAAPAAAAPAASSTDRNGNGIADIDEKMVRWAMQNKETNPIRAKAIMERVKIKYPKIYGN